MVVLITGVVKLEPVATGFTLKVLLYHLIIPAPEVIVAVNILDPESQILIALVEGVTTGFATPIIFLENEKELSVPPDNVHFTTQRK